MVISPLIYAEVSVGYETVDELEELLPASDYEREQLPGVLPPCQPLSEPLASWRTSALPSGFSQDSCRPSAV